MSGDIANLKIANFALAHLGLSERIANINSPIGTAQKVVKNLLQDTIDTVKRDYDWKFLTRFAALTLVEENPTTHYQFSYRQPANCLKFRKILGANRVDSEESRVKFRLGSDSQGILIYTDESTPTGEFTTSDDPGDYPADFSMACGRLLAALAAPTLTDGDRTGLETRNLQLYSLILKQAQKNDAQEQPSEPEPESSFIRIRDGSYPTTAAGAWTPSPAGVSEI